MFVGDGTVTLRSALELSLFGFAILMVVVAAHLLGVIALYRFSARRGETDGTWSGYGETISEGCSVRWLLALLALGCLLLLLGVLFVA